ncbi:hypothetical protein E1297_13650 [Roseibium sp. RKSG952]|nr:hypothetical protein [Roseibium sp. RKSG952]MTH97034.1 hypothetical protein [Roseibium sp. RKSG952]
MDDRSTPEALIKSYYNAITRKAYSQAYSYLHQPQVPYADWKKGYADTEAVEVKTGPTQPDPGAGQIFWALPVAVKAETTDGKTSIYSGCYTIHLINPGMDIDPPYQPMQINSGVLNPTNLPFDQAVPTDCAEQPKL